MRVATYVRHPRLWVRKVYYTLTNVLLHNFSPGGGENLCCDLDLSPPAVTVSLTELPDGITQCASNSAITDVVVPYNEAINVTYSCQTSSGTVLWQVGGCRADRMNGSIAYQMADREVFSNEGVLIQDSSSSMSTLNLFLEGRQFLRERLQSDVITIQCLAVVDGINLFGGNVYRLYLYGMSMIRDPYIAIS